MVQKAPGKHYREGISFKELMKMFSTEDAAREWLESAIWPDGPYCPKCGSLNVKAGISHSTMTHRCRDCPNRPQFSLKSGTVMKGTKLDYRDWAIAVYILTTNLKSVSSMKLHRDLEITQKSAWHLLHRLRKAFEAGHGIFDGPVEADETYFGGQRKNMSKSKRKGLKGRGAVDKTAVAGVKDRETNQVSAEVVHDTTGETLRGFVEDRTKKGAQIYTDDATAYKGILRPHEAVKHSAGEYVRNMAHTNGIESFWAGLKRAHKGTFHKISPKHLNRYVKEFEGRHNDRDTDTKEQMARIVTGMTGKQLRYADLTADNGLDSGARG